MPSHLPNLAGSEDLESLEFDEVQRRHQRLEAPPCRPVPIQLLHPDGAPRTDWFYADILDISLGGLCLLITENHALEVGHGLLVDFKAHRATDLYRVPGLVRWFVRSGSVTTLGVGFVEPLQHLPQLLPERRNRLRDPNEQAPAEAG